MFQTGQLVVYGSTGVCRVEGIGRPECSSTDKLYYLLQPLYQSGVIYAPVDSQKVLIRPVISKQEAERLVDQISTLHPQVCRGRTLQQLSQYYQSVLQSSDCLKLAELAMSIHLKKEEAERQKRRLCTVDERYMRQVERVLHGELSAALGIPFDQVPGLIAAHVKAAKLQSAQ